MKQSNATAVFLLILWGLATSLVVIVVAPFAGSLFAAAVVAGVLYPVQAWLSSRLGDRAALAAGLITAGAVFVVVAPLVLLGLQGGRQLAGGLEHLQQTVADEGVDGAIEGLPEALRDPAKSLADRLPTGWLVDSEGSGPRPASWARVPPVLEQTRSVSARSRPGWGAG